MVRNKSAVARIEASATAKRAKPESKPIFMRRKPDPRIRL